MKPKVVIVDYQMGNIFSVEKKIKRLGYPVEVSSDKEQIVKADKLILPGLGHFGKAMDNLKMIGLLDVLNEKVLVKKTPILGICLGMQLLANRSEEGHSSGLGWINGEVVKFSITDKFRYKIPHTGWNTVSIKKSSQLMKDIQSGSEFYFVHSFFFSATKEEEVLSETVYENSFISSVEKDNIFGVQFHPEKSHQAGEQLFKNFIEL